MLQVTQYHFLHPLACLQWCFIESLPDWLCAILILTAGSWSQSALDTIFKYWPMTVTVSSEQWEYSDDDVLLLIINRSFIINLIKYWNLPASVAGTVTGPVKVNAGIIIPVFNRSTPPSLSLLHLPSCCTVVLWCDHAIMVRQDQRHHPHLERLGEWKMII